MPELILILTAVAVILVVRVVRARLAATDAAAIAQGWTVTKLPWGGRVYRDPRLDQLAAHRPTSATSDLRSVHCGREAS